MLHLFSDAWFISASSSAVTVLALQPEPMPVCMCMQTDRYEEYPKLRELIQRKDDLAEARATPPYYLKVSF